MHCTRPIKLILILKLNRNAWHKCEDAGRALNLTDEQRAAADVKVTFARWWVLDWMSCKHPSASSFTHSWSNLHTLAWQDENWLWKIGLAGCRLAVRRALPHLNSLNWNEQPAQVTFHLFNFKRRHAEAWSTCPQRRYSLCLCNYSSRWKKTPQPEPLDLQRAETCCWSNLIRVRGQPLLEGGSSSIQIEIL